MTKKRSTKAACTPAKPARRAHAMYFDDSKPFGETKQAPKREVDINNIIRRHIDFGTPLPESPPPVFADVTGVSFEKSLNVQRAVSEAFSELPADIRAAFSNNPAEYIDFCHENADDISEHGMKAVLSGNIDVEGTTRPVDRDYGKFRRAEEAAQAEITDSQESAKSDQPSGRDK